MKNKLKCSGLTLITVIVILTLSNSLAQASSINILDENPSLNVETMAGGQAEWSWYIFNNNVSSPVRLNINVDIIEGGEFITGRSIYMDGILVDRVKIEPREGVDLIIVIEFPAITWVNDIRDHYRIVADLRESIDGNFRKYDIEMPFPQRDVWIREKNKKDKNE